MPTSANASGSASGLVHLIGNQVGTLTMADVAALTYRAFISYSHKDTDRATWLHRRLERYPLKGLTGRDTPRGPVPKTLRPIFRDRHDFSAGFTLKEQTVTALDASAALIVLASPASAKSLAVNEEIRLFRVLYPDRPVIPPIAGGRPDGGGEEECFPSALKFAISADGAITDTPVTILGADLRDEGDGEELALAKVVAALIGVPSDEVFRRAERERRRAARIRSAIAAGFVALAGAGGYFSWQAYRQQAELVDIQKLVDQYAPIGSAEARQPGARERLAATFASIAKGTAADPRYRQALDLLKAGKPQDAEPLLKQSAEEEEAAGLARIKQAAEKYRNLGSIASTSDPKRARDYYAKAVQLDPANIRGLADSAELEKDAGNLVFAEKSYASVLALGRKGEHDRDRYFAALGLGDIALARGNLNAALTSYRDASADADSLAKADPTNAGWQRDLSVSYDKVGDVLQAQGDLPGALKAHRDSLAIRDRRAKADPANAAWQRDLSVSYDRIGDVLKAQGDLPGALKAYRDSLAIRNRLAKADPANAGWQRDVAVSYAKLADVFQRQNEAGKAREAYAAGLAIMKRMAALSPDNSTWKRDLAWFEARLPALEENAAATQAAQGIAAAREAGEHAKAAKLGLDQARAIEAAETEKDGKPGRKTASALGNYAFSAIFAKQYAEALAAAERAMSLAPDKLWIATNRAHALLFLGRADEARAAYLEHRGKPMPGNENKPWEQVIADDFTELQKRGLSHPQMAEVLAALSR